MKFELPPLPYASNALEPVISAETISFHYGKHHQAYVNNLNNLIGGTRFENATLEQIVMEADGGIFNNGAQVWNHTFYWESLGAKNSAPGGKLLAKLNEDFGSYEQFKTVFADAAAKLFGSGWAWLVLDEENKLRIVQTSNAGNPLRNGQKPLLTCDVWEHAYYLDYQNRRPDYIKSFWDIVNWDKVAERLG
ncbi:MAG: superoxide dismutase [Lentimicrobiaceae bacterium]|nr:superoxide dismutase [Lentimicrobiaceae bacterium]